MKYVYLLIFLASFQFSCRKTDDPSATFGSNPVFFKSNQDMVHSVEQAIQKSHPSDKLLSISHVSYINSKDKSYALVFYQSSRKSGNLLLAHQYAKGVLVASTASTCEGTGCDCKVMTTISDNGDVKVNCSCSTCTMLTNQNGVTQ